MPDPPVGVRASCNTLILWRSPTQAVPRARVDGTLSEKSNMPAQPRHEVSQVS